MADNNCNSGCEGCEASCAFNAGATITLELDDGSTEECAVLTIFPAGDKQYLALLPLDENGMNEDGEVYIYRADMSGSEPKLENIESDEEYEAASDAFDEWLDSQEFDDIVTYEGDEE